MNETLFISHSVYLTPDERKKLATANSVVETVGISVAKNTKDEYEPLTEVWCKYILTNEDGGIELLPDGYKIHMGDFSKCETLLDAHEGGASWMMMRVDGNIAKGDKTFHVHHQVVFNDVAVLEKSVVCESLAQSFQQKK